MSESQVFLETYLREIGVHTPVSLLSFEAHSMGSDSIDSTGVMNKQPLKGTVPIIDSIDLVEVTHDQADALKGSDPIKDIKVLAEDAASCRLCALAETRKHVVFGRGGASVDVLFVGEAPNQEEDAQGEPFVGASGKLLDRMLHALGLKQEQVYIMNSIKCRPPNSRDPRPDEVQACTLWFDQQLAILQPKMICLLGRVAAQTVLNSDAPLGDLRGEWHDYHGVPAWVTYHPAYLLRSPRQKQKSWNDLLQMSQRLHV